MLADEVWRTLGGRTPCGDNGEVWLTTTVRKIKKKLY